MILRHRLASMKYLIQPFAPTLPTNNLRIILEQFIKNRKKKQVDVVVFSSVLPKEMLVVSNISFDIGGHQRRQRQYQKLLVLFILCADYSALNTSVGIMID